MNKLAEIKKNIDADWDDKPSVKKVCLSVIDLIVRNGDQVSYLTPELFTQQDGHEIDFDISLAALHYLAGYNEVLVERFEYVDDNGGSHPVSVTELAEAYNKEVFTDPQSGELITNFEDYIFMYYVPRESFLSLISQKPQASS